MFGYVPKDDNKRSAQRNPDAVTAALKKLARVPPPSAFAVATVAAVYAYFAAGAQDATKLFGLASLLVACGFAGLGINAVLRDMRLLRIIEAEANESRLRAMNHAGFERFLRALLQAHGYQVEPVPIDTLRNDDADLIARRKKEVMLVQLRFWDNDRISLRQVQSLYRASTILNGTCCMAVTLGRFDHEAKQWAERRGVQLVDLPGLMQLAATVLEVPPESLIKNEDETPDVAEEVRHERVEVARGLHRYLFIDFDAIKSGYPLLCDLIEAHPAFLVVASTVPHEETVDDIRDRLGECGGRLVGVLPPSPLGRYFAVMNYLDSLPEGKHTPWLAVDADPRGFPEGSIELVAVNLAFGFDDSAGHRLREAMVMIDKRQALP